MRRGGAFAEMRAVGELIKANLKRNPHFYDAPAPPGAPHDEEVAPRNTMSQADFESKVDDIWRMCFQSGLSRTREEIRANLLARMAKRGIEIVKPKPVLPPPDPRIVTTLGGKK